jgi:hypothetical protein
MRYLVLGQTNVFDAMGRKRASITSAKRKANFWVEFNVNRALEKSKHDDVS